MKRLKKWLKDEPRLFSRIIKIILVYTVVFVVYTHALSLSFDYFLGTHFIEDSKTFTCQLSEPLSMLKKVVYEEITYRLPLFIFGSFFGISYFTIIVNFLWSGIVFGPLVHQFFLALFIQGVLGVMLGFLFLKCGGRHFNFLKILKALFVTVSIHFLFNYTSLLLTLIW